MQVRLLPPPFGRSDAADVKSSCNPGPSGHARHALRPLHLSVVGLLCAMMAALPQASFAAVKLTGFTCASSSFSGAGTEACTVTLSGVTNSTAWVDLSTSSNAVNVPDDAFVQPNQSNGIFTAPVASINYTQTVTLTARYGGVSKTFKVKVSPAGSSSPAVSVSPTSLSFGTVNLNTPATRAITVTSSGSGALTLNSI
ncbi:MAG: hypothetical protein ACLGXA_13525, partial [Acidobacteriota bacterium]